MNILKLFADGEAVGFDKSKAFQGLSKNTPKISADSGAIAKLFSEAFFWIGIICVIMIIYAGIQYGLSAGDSGKAKTARATLLYAIIGLIITVSASLIVNFITGRL